MSYLPEKAWPHIVLYISFHLYVFRTSQAPLDLRSRKVFRVKFVFRLTRLSSFSGSHEAKTNKHRSYYGSYLSRVPVIRLKTAFIHWLSKTPFHPKTKTRQPLANFKWMKPRRRSNVTVDHMQLNKLNQLNWEIPRVQATTQIRVGRLHFIWSCVH